jgi:hypothetical protein
MVKDGCISYDTDVTKTFVDALALKNTYLAADIAAIRKANKDMIITLVTTGQKYTWTNRTAHIQYSNDAVAHEVHHAAQHAELGDNDSAVFDSAKGRLALEVSALATGEHAAGGNATRKVKEMLPKYHKELEQYACEGGAEAALAYAFGKSHMAYSKARMDALGILEAACK